MKKSGLRSPEQLMNYLIGRVMAATSGLANPQIVQQMIVERLQRNEST